MSEKAQKRKLKKAMQKKTNAEFQVTPMNGEPHTKKRKSGKKSPGHHNGGLSAQEVLKGGNKKTPKEINNSKEDEEWEAQENGSASEGESEDLQAEIQSCDGKEIGAVNVNNSIEEGKKSFEWMMSPHSVPEFFSKYWEKKPLHIKRDDKNYFGDLFSTADLDNILRNNNVQFSKNLDITSYVDGTRETHNPSGRAHPPVVWDFYNNGCSVRMLNPQTFHRRVWGFLSTLQEYFNSFCGANVYLTPPGTQGFAPHWDDIEAFLLQLEGQKRWRVYKPRNNEEELPVYSSGNLSNDDIGEPILDVILKPGDVLYFPRGFIHQAYTFEDKHSLHITVSTYQKNTWGHYLEKLLPQALRAAMEDEVEFRKGLPRNYLNCMGVANMDYNVKGREAFVQKIGELVTRMMENAPLDAAADQMGLQFIHDSLPPLLSEGEKDCSIFGGGERWCGKEMTVVNSLNLAPTTPVRLTRGNCLRVVPEEEKVRIYHTLENSREYHAEEPQFFEIEPENAPLVEALIQSYPKYVRLEDLPLDNWEEKDSVITSMFERGLIVTSASQAFDGKKGISKKKVSEK